METTARFLPELGSLTHKFVFEGNLPSMRGCPAWCGSGVADQDPQMQRRPRTRPMLVGGSGCIFFAGVPPCTPFFGGFQGQPNACRQIFRGVAGGVGGMFLGRSTGKLGLSAKVWRSRQGCPTIWLVKIKPPWDRRLNP